MSTPGWYQTRLDAPGTHRWWDGQRWTTQVRMAPPPPPLSPRVGRLSLRVAARAIDFVLLMVLASSINRIWAPRVLGADDFDSSGLLRLDELTPIGQTAIVAVAIVAIAILWELYWLISEGATPGKQLLGLYVTDPTNERGTVALGRAGKRNVHRLIAVVPFGWVFIAASSMVSLFWMSNDHAYRRSVMDLFAGTKVHEVPPGSPRFTPWLRVWASAVVGAHLAGWLLN